MNLFVILLLFFLFPQNFSIADSFLHITNVENKVFVLNNYGDRYLLNKSKRIRRGDFIKTINHPASIIFKNHKICLSKESAFKIELINHAQNLLNISFLKGKFIFFLKSKNKVKYNFKIFKKKILYDLGYIFLHKKTDRSFIIQSFQNNINIFNEYSKKEVLEADTSYEIKPRKISKYNNLKLYKSDFLNGCNISFLIQHSLKRKNYRCSNLYNKLLCGYQ